MTDIYFDQQDKKAKDLAEQLVKALSGRSVTALAKPYSSHGNAKVFISGQATSQDDLRQCYANGAAVIRADRNLGEVLIDDLVTGFLEQEELWYAKIFPDPVIIADYKNLKMELGSTINPRAIILNAGLEGKGGKVAIGRASHIGADALLNLGCANFTVENFSLISANFSAHTMRHTTGHISNFAVKKGPFGFLGSVYEDAQDIEIGHDVWVGEGVTCLPGVKLADGCVIGAGAVVTKSTDPYGIYAGNSAKLIRYRFQEEKIKALQDSGWWYFSYHKLLALREEFEKDITALSVDEIKEALK